MTISDQQRRLLDRLSADAERGVSEFPSSRAQRRQWLLHQLAPDASSYAMPLALRLRGALDVPALRQAVSDLAMRHEALRTTFTERDGEPVQVVHAHGTLGVELRDLRGPVPHDAMRAEAFRPFDLENGPLVRVIVWRLAAGDHVLLLVAHHIVADGWSVPVLLADLAAGYRSHGASVGPGALPALSIQPADYAVWEASHLSPARLGEDLDYWHSELAGNLPQLPLPVVGEPRPWAPAPAGTVRTRIGGELAERVRALARANRSTDFDVLLAAFAALLHQVTGQRDLVFGTPVPGRMHRDTAGLVGCFVNTLPLRLRLTDGDSMTAERVLAQAHTKVTAALAHQAAPLDLIVARLNPGRDTMRTPLFDVVFTVQDELSVTGVFDNLTAEMISLDPAQAKFSLTCVAERAHGEFCIQWDYRADLFEHATITALAESFTVLLAAMLADPRRPVAELALPGPGLRGRAAVTTTPAAGTTRPPARLPERGNASGSRPLTDHEAQIAAVWAKVLGAEPGAIRADDDFFLLGGHSFLAARVASRLGRMFGVDLSVRVVFENTTVAELAAWLRDGAGPGTQEGPPSGPPRFERLEDSVTSGALSFAQERLWFLAQLTPESPAYNIPLLARLQGTLDARALRRAVRWVVARHESLRTVFQTEGGEVSQHVVGVDEVLPELAVRDLSGQPRAAELARKLVNEDAFRPFDVNGGSLLRLLVVRVGDEDHVVGLTVHHIAADGWAVALLVQDLCDAYTAYLHGTEPAAGDPGLRYLEYAAWQREHMAGQVLADGLDWWRRSLAGAPRTLDLPSSRSRPPVRRQRGAGLPFEVSPELTASLRDLARSLGCTEFMVLFAAFAVVLGRYSGQRDILIGTPVANRADPATETLVGLLTNTVVLRARLEGDPDVGELLRRARETCIEAFAHADTPFEKLVEHLSPARDQSRSPLFQVMLALNNAPAPDLRLAGLTCTPWYPDNPTAKFDVLLNLASDQERITGVCEFDTSVYDTAMLSSLLRHLVRMLEAIAAGPAGRLSAVDLLGSDERAILISRFNCTAARYDTGTCLHTLVERAADQDPDALAVVPAADGGRALSYRQLDVAANQVAWQLIERNVRPDDVVGVYAHRSPELVVAEYGVLKAGAAFLPLDPSWPSARVAAVLGDSGCRVVLTDQVADSRLPSGVGAVPLAAASGASPCSRPEVAVRPANRAYVMYTSGSTGSPKGVQIVHEAICNNLLWMQQEWPLDRDDRLLHKTAETFDVAVKEVFWPLLAGAQLVLARPGSERDPESLIDQVNEHAITVTHFVPSVLDLILRDVTQRDTTLGARLRYVMSGAETLQPATREMFAGRCGADLLHMYGPTEATIAVTGWLCRRDDPPGRPVPLGRPMPNCALYVLDRDLNPVPALVPGELYVGGTPLARGYLGRPAETAVTFVPDPFSDRPGSRMYRTGDLARHGPDGLLEFRGRNDSQVKVRGFRIELGEVEAVLRSHPGVAQAAVIVSATGRPEAHLTAYVTASPGEPPTGEQLRGHIRQSLPEHMVPATVTILDRLPLGDHAKVDRAALAALAGSDRPERTIDSEYVPPRGDTEQAVADVWSEVLGVSRIGVHDDFFALGGHSLQAARIVARLRELTGRDVPLRDMFADPTVAAVAQLLAAAPRALPPIRRRRRRDVDDR